MLEGCGVWRAALETWDGPGAPGQPWSAANRFVDLTERLQDLLISGIKLYSDDVFDSGSSAVTYGRGKLFIADDDGHASVHGDRTIHPNSCAGGRKVLHHPGSLEVFSGATPPVDDTLPWAR